MVTSLLPTHLSIQETVEAGKCIHTSKTIAPGELVLRIDHPLALALDEPQLRETCEGCLQSCSEDGGGNAMPVGAGAGAAEVKRLKDCMGCLVVRYCGKACQAKAWKCHHKLECKIFKSLYPKVLPNTVRLLMQLLLRRKAGTLADPEWHDFLSLLSHLDEIKAQKTKNDDGLTTWEVIELMSEAASSYSRTEEPMALVQEMAARICTNSHTLTGPGLDPIGIYLSPTSALLNHSCLPNTVITFSHHGALSLRSLTTIPASTALTVSYIDPALPTALRRAELRSRYHFTCGCPACLANCTSSLSNPDILLQSSLLSNVKSESARLLAAATFSSSTDPHTALQHLQAANALFAPHRKHYPPHRHPRHIIHSQILLIALNQPDQWPLAFRHVLVGILHIDPVHHPDQPWHPLRVVRTWVALRLAMQMASLGLEATTATATAGVGAARAAASKSATPTNRQQWSMIILSLWRLVSANVNKSHGADSVLAVEVAAFGTQTGLRYADVEEAELKREWARLKDIAEEVLR